MKNSIIKDLFISPKASIHQAIDNLNRNVKGIVLVVDADRHLLGTITDGDIRRAITGGDALDTPIASLLACKSTSIYPHPITAPVGAGAVVTREVPAHTTVVGIPAKPIILKKAKPDIFFNTYSKGEK